MEADFLHGLMHDLKGPISRIAMLGELIRRRSLSLDSDTQALLQHIADSGCAVERVLDAVRRYIEAVEQPFHKQQFRLADAVDKASRRIEAQLTESRASVERELLPEITGDLRQMTSLFVELLANAIRFRGERALVIHIAAQTSAPDSWLICIRDNGVGFDGVRPDRLFRPFAKGSKRAGAGMGLAICDWIAKAHGGTIQAAARSDGAEFQLRLPRIHKVA